MTQIVYIRGRTLKICQSFHGFAAGGRVVYLEGDLVFTCLSRIDYAERSFWKRAGKTRKAISDVSNLLKKGMEQQYKRAGISGIWAFIFCTIQRSGVKRQKQSVPERVEIVFGSSVSGLERESYIRQLSERQNPFIAAQAQMLCRMCMLSVLRKRDGQAENK